MYVSPYPPVEGIFGVGGVVIQAIETDGVGLILGPKQLRLFLVGTHINIEMVLIERLVLSTDVVG